MKSSAPKRYKSMADKRENEMSNVDSVDYLRAIKGNDSVLLPISKLIDQGDVVGYKGFQENDDLNNYKRNGVYGHSNTSTLNTVTNRPAGTVGEAVLLVLSCSNNYISQIYFNITENSISVRFLNYNQWTSWRKISFIS